MRVLRLNKIITYLRSTEEIKAFLKLNKLIFFLIIYLHTFACMWWWIIRSNKEWVPTILYRGD